MKRRKLLKPNEDAEGRGDSQSSGSSLFDVIRRGRRILLSEGRLNPLGSGEENVVLKSVITSQKESLYPLTRILSNDGKLELMESFREFLRKKLGKSQNLGYISKRNAEKLRKFPGDLKRALDSDLHIFNSEEVRYSSRVLVFRGKIEEKNYDLLLNKEKIKWFVNNCEDEKVGFSARLKALVNRNSSESFVEEKLSLVLLKPVFLSSRVVVAKVFVVIY